MPRVLSSQRGETLFVWCPHTISSAAWTPTTITKNGHIAEIRRISRPWSRAESSDLRTAVFNRKLHPQLPAQAPHLLNHGQLIISAQMWRHMSPTVPCSINTFSYCVAEVEDDGFGNAIHYVAPDTSHQSIIISPPHEPLQIKIHTLLPKPLANTESACFPVPHTCVQGDNVLTEWLWKTLKRRNRLGLFLLREKRLHKLANNINQPHCNTTNGKRIT